MGCLLSKFLTKTPSTNAGSGGQDNPEFTNLDECVKKETTNVRNIRRQPSDRYVKDIVTVSKKAKPVLVRAMFNYGATEGEKGTEDLYFKAGELMEIVKSDDDWWLARRIDGSEEGYIPSNFVEAIDSPLAYPWYHGNISRPLAEKKLRNELNDTGTFLIRESNNSECSHALSILSKEVDKKGLRVVKHYRIKMDEDETKYFIVSNRTYSSLEELVQGYTENSENLCCNLYLPCPKQNPTVYDLNKTTSKNPEIPFSELTFVSKLSEGFFGEVWKGKHRDKMDIAIKKLKEGTMPIEKFLDEARTMKTLRHERLVPLLAVSSDNGTHYIITELLLGSLLDFLKKSPEQHIIDLLGIASQIADGMAYMESQGYIHRDLAARNILMVDENNIKIGDFGLSRIVKDEDDGMYISSKETKLPIRWTALESIEDNVFTIKSDVWSFGIVLVELTTRGRQPYQDKKNQQLITFLHSGRRHTQPPVCPDELYALMLECWNVYPEERPTFSEIFTRIEKIITALYDDQD